VKEVAGVRNDVLIAQTTGLMTMSAATVRTTTPTTLYTRRDGDPFVRLPAVGALGPEPLPESLVASVVDTRGPEIVVTSRTPTSAR